MVNVKLYDAHELDDQEWRQMQTIARDGMTVLLQDTVPQEAIDAYVGWDDPEGFCLSHLDPNSEVGKHFAADQSFSHPTIAIATHLDKPVGFMYSANNVSGATEEIRRRKQLSVVKNYRWIREVAVAPGAQQRGIAYHLGRSTLLHTLPIQPVSTYIYPSVVPFLQEKLELFGFHETDVKPVYAFGEDRDPVNMVRMQANCAMGVLARLYFDRVRNITVDYS